MKKKIEDMSVPELLNELKRLRESLCDLQEVHEFTFGKTSAHMGAERAQNMQEEYEDDCRRCREDIALLERQLKDRNPE